MIAPNHDNAPPTNAPLVLWNPNAAACWSLLFSPAFGAFLHARNAEVLGRVKEARANTVWFYVAIAYLGFALVTIFVPAIPEPLFQAGAVGLLLGWYFSLGKKQIAYVKETCRDHYQHKPWKGPLLIAFGCLIGACILAVAVVGGENRDHHGGAPVRVFMTDSDWSPGEIGRALKGVFLWPSDRELGRNELARVANPLFNPEPSWGSYSGVGQSSVDERNFQAHLAGFEQALWEVDFAERHADSFVPLQLERATSETRVSPQTPSLDISL